MMMKLVQTFRLENADMGNLVGGRVKFNLIFGGYRIYVFVRILFYIIYLKSEMVYMFAKSLKRYFTSYSWTTSELEDG